VISAQMALARLNAVPFWDGYPYTPHFFERVSKMFICFELQSYGKRECGRGLD